MKKLLCKLLRHCPYYVYDKKQGQYQPNKIYKCYRCGQYLEQGPYNNLWEIK